MRRKLHTPHPPSLLCSRSSSCALSSLLSLPQPLWVRHVPPRLHPSRRTGMLTSPTHSVPYPTAECSTPQPWHQRRVRRCFGANAVQLCSVLVCWFHGRALCHGSPQCRAVPCWVCAVRCQFEVRLTQLSFCPAEPLVAAAGATIRPVVLMHGLGDAGSNPGMQSLAKSVMAKCVRHAAG